jgi:hypothetical protein
MTKQRMCSDNSLRPVKGRGFLVQGFKKTASPFEVVSLK